MPDTQMTSLIELPDLMPELHDRLGCPHPYVIEREMPFTATAHGRDAATSYVKFDQFVSHPQNPNPVVKNLDRRETIRYIGALHKSQRLSSYGVQRTPRPLVGAPCGAHRVFSSSHDRPPTESSQRKSVCRHQKSRRANGHAALFAVSEMNHWHRCELVSYNDAGEEG